jgi:hypothetical protein
MTTPAGARFSNQTSVKGPGAVEVVDEAAAFLRRTPLSSFIIYYLGALPFTLGLIYFVFDMLQSANAERHLGPESLVLTLLYFWMKTCQAVFSRRLLAMLEGGDSEPWTVWRWANTAILQAIYAATLLIVYPMALLITIPFGWVNAFYHNISIVATGGKTTLRGSFAEAAELAALWPRQNHLILAVLLAGLFFLFINLYAFFLMLPSLLNSFFGISTIFEESRSALNNTTFFLEIFVFCYLVLNPLNKAIFVLRCFYGRARLDGADLRAELRRQNLTRKAQVAAATIALALLAMLPEGVRADDTPTPAASVASHPAPVALPPDSKPATLDHAIQKTLQKDEFAWRLPRTDDSAQGNNVINETLEKFFHYIERGLRVIFRPIVKFLEWLFGSSKPHDGGGSGLTALASFPWMAFFCVLLVIVVAFLAFLIIRNIQRKALPSGQAVTTTPVKTVDLESDNVRADELPEDSWLALAQQLLEKGENRLALRAFYLATLSLLARLELIRLGTTKSNRDYLQEFTRRLRGNVSVVPPFRENIRLFEESWYGTHDATSSVIDAMRVNHEQLRTHVAV